MALFANLFVVAQDLGSSSELFKKTPTPSARKSSRAKAAPKKITKKPVASVKKKEPVNRAAIAPAVAKSAPVEAPAKTGETSDANPLTKTGETKTSDATAPAPTVIMPGTVVIKVGETPEPNNSQLAELAIERGNIARDERNYIAAETEYRRAQAWAPADSRPIFGLGNLYSDQQRWEEAEAAYRQAIALEPNEPEAHIALSFVLSQPVFGANLSARYEEAGKVALRAIELSKNNAVAYDQLGLARELLGQIGVETQTAYRKAIELDPNFAIAYAHLGRLLRRNGLAKESEAAYKDAIRLAKDVPTMILVADVMQSQQRFEESEKLLKRALQDDPRNPTGLLLYGRALTIRGKFDEAEIILKRAVAVSPKSFVAYVSLGSLYARRENFEAAEEHLMMALKVVSKNERKRLAQEFENVGDGLMRSKKKKDAARLFRQALELDAEKASLTSKLAAAEKR